MDHTMSSRGSVEVFTQRRESSGRILNLSQGNIDTEYIIQEIKTNDEDLRSFLFSLGCYEGEKITIISVLAENFVLSVKDARYSIDRDLAEAIRVI
jgi:ferrous iron transport protein A